MEFRKGKKLSTKNALALGKAHKLLAKVLQDADPKDAQKLVGGPQGDQGANDPYSDGSAGVEDATGSRTAYFPHPTAAPQIPTIQRTIHGPVEVR